MNTTIYEFLVQLVGQPTSEYGEYALYIGAVFITVFVMWSITSIILALFRGGWSRL